MIISNVHLIEAIKDLYFKNESGILRAEDQNIKKYFYFKQGNIVFAHSNLLSEKIGQIMVKMGFVPRDQLNKLLHQKPENMRFGAFLINKGMITANELNSALLQQIKTICFGAFRWGIIPLLFEHNNEPVFEELIVQVSTPDLLIEGISQLENTDPLFTNIPDLMDTTIKKIEDESMHLPRATLNADENLLLSLIEENLTVRDLISKSEMQFKIGMLTVYSLYISGLILFVQPEKEEPPAVAITEILPDLGTEDKVVQYISSIYPQLYKINFYDLLCIEPDSDSEKMQEHYDYYMDHLQPMYYYTGKYKSWQTSLKYIIDYFNDAYDTLNNPNNKKEYDRKLKEGTLETKEHPGLHTEAEPNEPRKYSFEIHPVESKFKDDSHKIIAAEEMESVAAAAAAVEKAPSPTEGLKYAEHLFKLKKYSETLQALTSLESTYKKESKYHFLMGATLANFPDKNKEAEEYLLRAFAVEPKNPEYLLHLGLFYKSIGLGIKAFKFLNEVLKIDPNNKIAKEALGLKHTILDN
jgi:tetratricopeptide (TPR) repeat protein